MTRKGNFSPKVELKLPEHVSIGAHFLAVCFWLSLNDRLSNTLVFVACLPIRGIQLRRGPQLFRWYFSFMFGYCCNDAFAKEHERKTECSETAEQPHGQWGIPFLFLLRGQTGGRVGAWAGNESFESRRGFRGILLMQLYTYIIRKRDGEKERACPLTTGLHI